MKKKKSTFVKLIKLVKILYQSSYNNYLFIRFIILIYIDFPCLDNII